MCRSVARCAYLGRRQVDELVLERETVREFVQELHYHPIRPAEAELNLVLPPTPVTPWYCRVVLGNND